MIASSKKAARILQQWQANSSKVRVTFGSSYALVTCYCTLHRVDDASWIWCTGNGVNEEIRFDLAGATSVALINCSDVPEELDCVADLADEALSITWPDGTRLNLVKEKTRVQRRRAS